MWTQWLQCYNYGMFVFHLLSIPVFCHHRSKLTLFCEIFASNIFYTALIISLLPHFLSPSNLKTLSFLVLTDETLNTIILFISECSSFFLLEWISHHYVFLPAGSTMNQKKTQFHSLILSCSWFALSMLKTLTFN